MKTDSFSASRILLPLWLALLAPVSWGQTFYSPGGVGTVGTDTTTGNTTTDANIFAWDLNANSNTSGYDISSRGGSSTLTISGPSGEFFRVVFGPNVDLNIGFWNVTQEWTNFITRSGSATIPTLSQSSVSAYTYNGTSYTLVDTSSKGAFSLASNTLTWTAIPEPSSALAGMLLVGGLLRRRR